MIISQLSKDNINKLSEFDLQQFISYLEILSLYSRLRVSNDNPYSEAHFKTMKYRPSYP